jgi:hypothetical protein
MRQLLTIMSVCLTAGLCFAGATVYVDDNAPSDPGPGDPLISDPAEDGSTAHPYDSIQQAIDSSDPNFVSEVIILPGTYTGTGNRDIDFKGKPITVRGINPDDPNVVAATIIDCHGTQAEPHRGFYFHTGETETSVLKGVTITNGYGLSEANLFHGGSPYIVGGGIFCRTASPKLEAVVVRNSEADRGGGILTTRSNPHLVGCMFLDNAAKAGGAVYFFAGNADLEDCLIRSNRATILGGAGYIIEGTASVQNCAVRENRSGLGGAFYIYESEISFESVIVNANAADASGGAIYFRNCLSGSHLRNCLFAGNYSQSGGGAAYVETSLVDFSNCTFAGNRAVTGGGIYGEVDYPFGTSVQLKDCIVWGNEAARGNQIAFGSSDEPAAGGLQAWYSDIEGGIAAVFKGDGRFGFYEGTLDVDPLFADPGRWLDNGTPDDMSDDKWVNGDYHLKSYAGRWDPAQEEWVLDDVHSPCIDAGDPSSAFSQEPVYNGGRINMGTYGGTEQASKTPSCPQPPLGDLNNDCKVTFADLALFAANWLDCNLEPPIACE